jgi:hypothetical protein
MLSARSSKNIKISTFEKASKSFHFRSDNQRQISLDLNYTCRIRKRLISLINFEIFLEIIRLTRCEYSKLVFVYSFSEGGVLVSEEGCAYIQRGVSVSLIVDSLSESRLKSVRFLVEKSGELMTSDELMKIIKINH